MYKNKYELPLDFYKYVFLIKLRDFIFNQTFFFLKDLNNLPNYPMKYKNVKLNNPFDNDLNVLYNFSRKIYSLEYADFIRIVINNMINNTKSILRDIQDYPKGAEFSFFLENKEIETFKWKICKFGYYVFY